MKPQPEGAVASGELKALDLVCLPGGRGPIQSRTRGCRTLVDGGAGGKVPGELRLSAARTCIEIRRDGLEPFRTRILPRPGFPQEVQAALKRREAAPAAGLIRAKNGYELKLIAPGSFSMGSSRREQGRRSNETLRPVRLTRAFYMGTREVTNREFREFAATHTSGAFKNQDLNRDDLPAVMVAWEQAALFCNWLSVRESLSPVYIQKDGRVAAADLGKRHRLPTEAEWSFAPASNTGRSMGRPPVEETTRMRPPRGY
jgi:formylglycine-generating enzyme required for sulfatase activity